MEKVKMIMLALILGLAFSAMSCTEDEGGGPPAVADDGGTPPSDTVQPPGCPACPACSCPSASDWLCPSFSAKKISSKKVAGMYKVVYGKETAGEFEDVFWEDAGAYLSPWQSEMIVGLSTCGGKLYERDDGKLEWYCDTMEYSLDFFGMGVKIPLKGGGVIDGDHLDLTIEAIATCGTVNNFYYRAKLDKETTKMAEDNFSAENKTALAPPETPAERPEGCPACECNCAQPKISCNMSDKKLSSEHYVGGLYKIISGETSDSSGYKETYTESDGYYFAYWQTGDTVGLRTCAGPLTKTADGKWTSTCDTLLYGFSGDMYSVIPDMLKLQGTSTFDENGKAELDAVYHTSPTETVTQKATSELDEERMKEADTPSDTCPLSSNVGPVSLGISPKCEVSSPFFPMSYKPKHLGSLILPNIIFRSR